MKNAALAFLNVGILVFLPLSSLHALDIKLNETPARIFFSPEDDCTGTIVKEISKAKSSVLVQAYAFTSEEIAAALIQVHKRGIPVEIILDKSNRWAKSGSGDAAVQAGIATYLDSRHGVANNKVIIIDGKILITGSFNFTRAAKEKNAENLLVIRNRELAAAYLKNWTRHREHSVRYGSTPSAQDK